MLKILIVEDDLIFAKDLVIMLEKNACEVVGIANKYKDAVALFDIKKPDFLFIDIELKGKETGIDFANYVNGIARVPFIYLTNYYGSKYPAYFNQANDTNHYNFLPKLQIEATTLWHHVEVALDRYKRENNLLVEEAESSYVMRGFIYIKPKLSNNFRQIPINSILYLKAGRPYCEIYTDGGVFHIRQSLIKVLDFLRTPYLVQINANSAVNVKSIKKFSLTDSDIEIASINIPFKIGKQYRDHLFTLLPHA